MKPTPKILDQGSAPLVQLGQGEYVHGLREDTFLRLLAGRAYQEQVRPEAGGAAVPDGMRICVTCGEETPERCDTCHLPRHEACAPCSVCESRRGAAVPATPAGLRAGPDDGEWMAPIGSQARRWVTQYWITVLLLFVLAIAGAVGLLYLLWRNSR